MRLTRNVFAGLVAVCILLILSEWATAQPAAAASAASAPPAALTEADITRGTECGAPGVGRKWAGPTAEQIEAHPARPGYRVNEAGYWSVGCKPPAPPPPPPACPGSGAPVQWTVGEHTCTTARPRLGTTPASGLQQRIESGRMQILRQQFGEMRGTLIERCDAGVRSVVSATCAPAAHCNAGWYTQSAAGVRHTLFDRLPVGEYGQAKSSDGSTLRVQCVAGTVKPAPQCVAGQKVTQRYSGGPIDPATGKHIGDIRVYEYAGQPVDPGKLVTLTQIEGRRKPDGSPRTLVARCSTSGQLQ